MQVFKIPYFQLFLANFGMFSFQFHLILKCCIQSNQTYLIAFLWTKERKFIQWSRCTHTHTHTHTHKVKLHFLSGRCGTENFDIWMCIYTRMTNLHGLEFWRSYDGMYQTNKIDKKEIQKEWKLLQKNKIKYKANTQGQEMPNVHIFVQIAYHHQLN